VLRTVETSILIDANRAMSPPLPSRKNPAFHGAALVFLLLAGGFYLLSLIPAMAFMLALGVICEICFYISLLVRQAEPLAGSG
jgi:4-hydroxybenzoate polyprenyltransferase